MSCRVWRGWLALATVLVALSPTLRAESVDPLAAGDAAMRAFDIKTGLTAYRVAYRQQPVRYEAAWKLARTLVDQGTLLRDRDQQKTLYLEAVAIAREAVDLKPRDSAGHTSLAIAVGKLALFEGGKRQVELSREVKEQATLAVQLNPKDDLGYHVLGVWNREMVELNWALRQVAQLLYGKFPPASLDNAVAFLRRASEIAPENVAHHVELGTTYMTARQWNQADAALARALSLPRSWVTDDYYKAQAEELLKRVKPHVK